MLLLGTLGRKSDHVALSGATRGYLMLLPRTPKLAIKTTNTDQILQSYLYSLRGRKVAEQTNASARLQGSWLVWLAWQEATSDVCSGVSARRASAAARPLSAWAPWAPYVARGPHRPRGPMGPLGMGPMDPIGVVCCGGEGDGEAKKYRYACYPKKYSITRQANSRNNNHCNLNQFFEVPQFELQ